MYRPLSTVPFPVTITSPFAVLYDQPGPLETWAGTDFRVVPAGTPVLVASGNPHRLGAAAQLVSAEAFPLNAPTAARALTAASAATPITAPTSTRLLRPPGGRAPDSGEAGGSRPVLIWSAFPSVAMTLPSFIFLFGCHGNYQRYFFRLPEDNSLSLGRHFPYPSDLVIPARVFRPWISFPARAEIPGHHAPPGRPPRAESASPAVRPGRARRGGSRRACVARSANSAGDGGVAGWRGGRSAARSRPGRSATTRRRPGMNWAQDRL